MTTPEDFAGWEPYNPPWWPWPDVDSNVIVSSLSGDVVSRYEKWVRSLPPGELLRRIAESRAPACECGASASEPCPGEPLPCSRPTA